VAAEIIVPTLNTLVERTTVLRTLADAATGGGDLQRTAAQQAWRDTIAVFQVLEMLHLGPAGSPASFTGGLGLRDRVYAWPLVNACAIDQQTLNNDFQTDGWAAARLPNVIGLGALEYVMFVEDAANACPADATMNTDGSWTALGADEVRARRARYAAVVAADVALGAEALRDAWVGDAGFAATLQSAGERGSAFATAQQAVDELYAAMFALELTTKDRKLGVPAGLHVDCTTTTCPELLESAHAKASREHVLANLDAVRRVFVGIDGAGEDKVGFDDLLREANAAELSAAMIEHLDVAIAGIGAMGTYEDSAPELVPVSESYALIKAFTDDFKGEFASALGLRVPAEGAGDND
jgi:uncharacterized protein